MSEENKDIQDMSFEETFNELQELVQRLESGELPLEETVHLFERGTLLAQRCQSLLDQAELRVQQLVEGAGGAPVVMPFEPEG